MTGQTERAYTGLTLAYDHFNRELFEGRLPTCLITMQRKAKVYGYFAGGRFDARDGGDVTDEIAMNPSHFKDRRIEETLSTLVHEMTHVEQHHHGKASRTGYHNKQWAGLMRRVGLIPSSTGAPGGKETGQRVSHYIEQGGGFERACAALTDTAFTLPYIELWDEETAATRAKKAASKSKYTCTECSVNAWAKPDTKLICGDCGQAMVSLTSEPEADDAAEVELPFT